VKTMNPFKTRNLLLPFALLVVLVLAACASITPPPQAEVAPDSINGSNASNGSPATTGMQAGETNGNEMMGDSGNTDMMDDESANMVGNDSGMNSIGYQSVAADMNQLLPAMQSIVGSMADTPGANEMMEQLSAMQQDLQGMMNDPDAQRLGMMMNEFGTMMGQLQFMMDGKQMGIDMSQLEPEMEQLMSGVANMMGNVSQMPMSDEEMMYGDMTGGGMMGMMGMMAMMMDENSNLSEEEWNAVLDKMDVMHEEVMAKLRDGSMTQDDWAEMSSDMADIMDEIGIADMMSGQGMMGGGNMWPMTGQMNEMQRQLDDMMQNGALSPENYSNMMGQLGAMMSEMGMMLGFEGVGNSSLGMMSGQTNEDMMQNNTNDMMTDQADENMMGGRN